MTVKQIEEWIKRAEFTILPRYAPMENAPLTVVTVSGLQKLMREHAKVRS